tara:strand:- start:7906 stop:8571 length:666 start_codon:yes stop_codon:yes gene_type:complete
MATSGSVTFRPQVDDVIIEAYERVGTDIGKLTQYDTESAIRSLNLMFSEWSVRGINYWTVDKQSYTVSSGTANTTLPAGTLDILAMVVRRSGSDTVLSRMSLTTYHNLPNKTTTGRPSSYFLDRQYTPVVYLWPTPENSTDVIEYWRVVQPDDITLLAQDTDTPYRWSEAMCAGLATKLAQKKNPERYAALYTASEASFNLAAGDERERASLRIIPTSVIA